MAQSMGNASSGSFKDPVPFLETLQDCPQSTKGGGESTSMFCYRETVSTSVHVLFAQIPSSSPYLGTREAVTCGHLCGQQ